MSVLVSLLTVVWKPYTRDRESFLKVTSNKFLKKKVSQSLIRKLVTTNFTKLTNVKRIFSLHFYFLLVYKII